MRHYIHDKVWGWITHLIFQTSTVQQLKFKYFDDTLSIWLLIHAGMLVKGALGGCRKFFVSLLTHWGRVTHICVSKLTIIGSDNGLSPSHYQNQCWNIINWTLRNKLQWNFSRKSNIFIHKNALENVVCVIASILSRLQWVNRLMMYCWGPIHRAGNSYFLDLTLAYLIRFKLVPMMPCDVTKPSGYAVIMKITATGQLRVETGV